MSIWLQKSASIQTRTSLSKFEDRRFYRSQFRPHTERFVLVSIITLRNRRNFQLADYHDSQLNEISLLVQKANYRWRILIIKMRQQATYRQIHCNLVASFFVFQLMLNFINADFGCYQDIFSVLGALLLSFASLHNFVIFQKLCTVFCSTNFKNRKNSSTKFP